ncbi:hypothetical protein DVS28_a0014 [Euzebya pacifica]|jgi:DNA-directed RNA polymerase subunit RPC12/RpoP|uniref:Uncharacterized protein n=1 Tax=Euzebya pacifica TaxID=1608957 RepID=A0A346XR76_9ACTN|nr:hypothetical protein [Euzebya pacifica]AXV04723.1 hypothetical protein DVS28_a0014 [Euzebya pacifica]
MKRLVMVLFLVGVVAASRGLIPWQLVFAPLLGLLIWSIGIASFGSLNRGAAHIPDGPPEAVDPDERVTYTCTGCGAEVLLLVRGSAMPPRHCGEKMHERREVRSTRA